MAEAHSAERGTRAVAWVTAVMMVIEIWAGWHFNSMALLADGWHMSTHALAIGLSAAAYAIARRFATDPRFTSGTGKIETLAAYSSALVLLGIAGAMLIGAVESLIAPRPIQYLEAFGIAALGLAVNIVCASILNHAQNHAHAHGHSHEQGHGHTHRPDLNLRSAHLHVVADAATSVLALLALAGGALFGWNWLDPAMSIVGAITVAVWAWGLLKEAIRVLLDVDLTKASARAPRATS